MFSRFVLFISCLFFAVAGYAYDLTTAKNGIVKNLPICTVDGVEAKYIQSRKQVWARTVSIASVDYDKRGNPLIIIDPIAFADAPPEFQVWVALHECNHHLRNHLRSGVEIGFSPMTKFAQEHQSDRYASTKIVQAGFTEEQIQNIYDVIADSNYINRHSPPSHRMMVRMMGAMADKQNQLRAEYFIRSIRREQRRIR